MLFSSIIFLFSFLPITLLGYYLINPQYRNYWLLLTSLFFFAWGGVSFTIILIVSIVLNFLFGLLIQKNLENKSAFVWLFIGVSINIALLGVFKYTNFIVANLNNLFGVINIKQLPATHIILPVGISFYTFHSLSYLVDIYRRKVTAQKNIFDLSLYISMFSQLIAGPIIRYSDVWTQLRNRTHTLSKFSSGVERFLIGLGKKVLLANVFAKVADDIFAVNAIDLNAPTAWLGIVCYSLQIYCDFAGYSDMAIGLGRMFGFEFLENFNYPYIAKSVKEFWRRWHISLSSFFRDYVYIPLGGNRVKIGRTYLNLLLVFLLTGFWHGASWSFVVWGLFHGFFMVIEKLGFDKVLDRTWKPISNLYTILVVMFAWVLFRADTLTYAVHFWKAMFNFSQNTNQIALFYSFMNKEFYYALVVVILGSFGFYRIVGEKVNLILSNTKFVFFNHVYHFISLSFYLFIMIFSTTYLIAGTYNPFIYYRF
ncbi:MAG: MBOAT family O-acyltransferase [Bacteroidota bacterium]